MSLYDSSIFRSGLVYSSIRDMNLMLVTGRESRALDLIAADRAVSAVVSPDSGQIAWAYQSYGSDMPGSQLWIANVGGSNAQIIDEILPENNEGWLVFRPFEWTRDGRLIYGTKLTGIGGYILFDDWNSLSVYNPADNTRTLLVEEEPYGMCIHSVSADLRLAALGCNEIRIRRLADGSEITLPALDLQNVAGSARFSPSGARVAYATAANNPEYDRSQVVVAASDGSGEPYPIQTMEGGDFHVLGWINEDSFLFSAHEIISNRITIWRIDYDGSRPTKLIEAQFWGFIPA